MPKIQHRRYVIASIKLSLLVLPSSASPSIISSMNQPFKLYRLQHIDSKINSTRSRLIEVEISLNDNSSLRAAQHQAETTSQSLQEAQEALQITERNVQDLQIKIQQSEASLYGGKIKNPKELQDIQSEAASLNKYVTALEERQLDAMLLVEEAELELNKSESNLRSRQADNAGKNSELTEEQSNLLRNLNHHESERQVAVGSISPDDIKFYDLLRKQKNGVAVAIVMGENCLACGSTLSASLLQTAHSPTQLTRCATCGRILYVG